jgi:hypothetical protein
MRHIATCSVSRKQNCLTRVRQFCTEKFLTAQNHYILPMSTAWHMGCKAG